MHLASLDRFADAQNVNLADASSIMQQTIKLTKSKAHLPYTLCACFYIYKKKAVVIAESGPQPQSQLP